MVRAVLFDLFETLITESRTRPAGVSSLASDLGCDREAFRRRWKEVRPAVMTGRVPFRQALSDIATGLGSRPEDATLQRLCDARSRVKREPFRTIEPSVNRMLDDLRSRHVRLGVVSNCCAEDVAAWPTCSLAWRFDCTVFSFEVGLAKPDPEIYVEAARRLRVDASEALFIGDGGDEELSGAERAGLRTFRALWFLKQWPHFAEEASSIPSVESADDFVSLVDHAISPLDNRVPGPRTLSRRSIRG